MMRWLVKSLPPPYERPALPPLLPLPSPLPPRLAAHRRRREPRTRRWSSWMMKALALAASSLLLPLPPPPPSPHPTRPHTCPTRDSCRCRHLGSLIPSVVCPIGAVANLAKISFQRFLLLHSQFSEWEEVDDGVEEMCWHLFQFRSPSASNEDDVF